jgi:hypothetical protein
MLQDLLQQGEELEINTDYETLLAETNQAHVQCQLAKWRDDAKINQTLLQRDALAELARLELICDNAVQRSVLCAQRAGHFTKARDANQVYSLNDLARFFIRIAEIAARNTEKILETQNDPTPNRCIFGIQTKGGKY